MLDIGIYLCYYNIRNREKHKAKEETNMENTNKMIDMIAEAYIKVYGEIKWNSLTDNQKHEAVMIIAKDLMR